MPAETQAPLQTEATSANQTSANQEVSSLLDEIVEQGRIGQNETEKEKGRAWIGAFLEDVLQGQIKVSANNEAMINERILQIDELISAQLNAIIHDPKFQELESAWRGLKYLIDNTETSTMLKIKVMNVSKKDLLKDLNNVSEFDQSATFKKIYEEEYGVLGGQPFGALVGDYYFGRGAEDIELLEKMSNIAAASHAPFFSAVSPDMFGLTDYTQLNTVRDLAKIFDSDLFVRWKSFRESEDSKYVGLTMPRILMRLPYGPDTAPVDAFNFKEDVDGTDHHKYLWGNAAYAFASRLTEAFAKHEWCAAIRGVEGGGLVEGLPAHTFGVEQGDPTLKCPTEVQIPDRREAELSKLGFIPLCHHKGSDKAVFFGAQSCNKPKQYLNADANANARLSAQMQYTMAVSRFAHFLKVIMRDKIGSFVSRDNCQMFLNNWISNYVLLDDTATQEQKARYPLAAADIQVSDVAGKPGAYTAVALLRPHFQLDEISVSLRLVAKTPTKA